MPLFYVIAAVQLSATDLRDLRCVYVFETRSIAAGGGEKGVADQINAQWFRGRLSASQPKLNVFHYVTDHFRRPKVPVTGRNLEGCAKTIAEWEAEEVGPLR